VLFEVKALSGEADLSLLLVGPDNDGDTVEGIRWAAKVAWPGKVRGLGPNDFSQC